MGRVDPLDVVSRVCFGETERLGFTEDNVESLAFIGHFCQYEVGCTVHNPQQGLNPVSHKAFLQGLDNGNSAAHAGFVSYIYAFFFGCFKYFIAVGCQERLIGRYHVLFMVEGFQYKRAGRLIPTYEFDDYIYFRIIPDRPGIGGKNILVNVNTPRRCYVQIGNFFYDKPRPQPLFDKPGLILKHLHYACSDRAETDQSDVYILHHLTLQKDSLKISLYPFLWRDL